jgi:hypothetical protein
MRRGPGIQGGSVMVMRFAPRFATVGFLGGPARARCLSLKQGGEVVFAECLCLEYTT